MGADDPVAPNRHVPSRDLIGREQELAELLALVNDPNAPLIVLTGPGGIGKSRLAAALARAVDERRARSSVVVELGSLPTDRPDLVLTSIAAAIGIDVPGPFLDAVSLGQAIADRPLLLVLDSMEHLIESAPHLTAILQVAPFLTILVTSQTVLGVYGERTYPVAPILHPTMADLTTPPPTREAVLAFDAVRLFVERAFGPQGLPANTPSEDLVALLTITARLEGHPLAIELAASHHRTSGDTLPAIAEALGLDGPHDQPGAPMPDMSPLQRTLARSYARLAPDDQAAFRRASLLGGVWSIADAVDVLAIGDEDAAGASIIRLLDASLIRALPTASDLPRMQMLAALRGFGTRLLEESGETSSTASRLAASVVAFAERAAPQLTGSDQNVWLDRIADRLPDIHRAFTWYAQSPDESGDAPLRLAIALWRFGYSRGHLREAVDWLEAALAQSDPAQAPLLRGRALASLGLLIGMQGDRDRARVLYQDALALGRELDDDELMGTALMGLGEQAVARQDLATAHSLIEQGSTHLTRTRNTRGRALALTNLANVLWSMRRLGEAQALNLEARTLYERVGDGRGVAWSVTNLGRLVLLQERYGEAIPLLHDALRRYEETDDQVGIVEALDALARCALAGNDADTAHRLLRATDHIREVLAFPLPEVDRAEDASFRDRLREHPAPFDPDSEPVPSLDDALALGYGVSAASIPIARVAAPDDTDLSPRERDVLVLLRDGMSNQEISDQLFIGIRTVQSHVLHLMRKLDASSRVAAVAIAMQRGILDIDE